MRKCLSILFLFISLNAYTPFREMWKLPVLVDHFMEHQAENPFISVLDFFDMHYIHDSPHDADYARDMQLPFKMVSLTSLSVFAIPSPPVYFPITPPVYNKKEKPILYNLSAYSFNYHNSIWQPPKAC